MLSLRELQDSFRGALLDGDASVLALVAADGLDAQERLDVHRNNVVASLTGVLGDAFPVVRRLVDERFFAYAAASFIQAEPPRRPCLSEYGQSFAGFLAAFPACRELVYLPDVARLEWQLHRAAHAAEAAPLPPSALAQVPLAQSGRLRLTLQPALAYLESRWPIDRIWRANASAAETVDLDAGGVRLEIGRESGTVAFRHLPESVFAFRELLAAGADLETAADATFAEDPTFDLAAALADLFREGAVTGFALNHEVSP